MDFTCVKCEDGIYAKFDGENLLNVRGFGRFAVTPAMRADEVLRTSTSGIPPENFYVLSCYLDDGAIVKPVGWEEDFNEDDSGPRYVALRIENSRVRVVHTKN